MTDSRFDQIVSVSTWVLRACPVCSKASTGGESFESGVNHLLREHRGVVLHAGQQTEEGPKGDPWQATVVVVGIPPDPLAGAR